MHQMKTLGHFHIEVKVSKGKNWIRECKTHAEWTGMAISSWPKNSFWNPSEPGFIIPATEGVSLPALAKRAEKG